MMKKLIFLLLSVMILNGCDSPVDSTTTTTDTTDQTPVFFPIVISPNNSSILTNSNIKLNVSGGKPPYSYTLSSGPGSIGTTGIYISDNNIGNVIIEVTDSVQSKATVRLRVVRPLALIPNSINMNVNSNFQFETSGGVAPYFYQIVNGGGIISTIGQYFSGATPTNVVVKVVDALGNEATANIVSNSLNQINPATVNMNRGDKFQFSSSFGFAPYTYRVVSGGGSVDSLGVYTAPTIAGAATVESIDSIGTVSPSVITINNLTLSLNNSSPIMQVNQSFTLKAVGGLAPYLFTFTGSGNLGSLLPTGTYFAPNTATVDHIKVTDSEGTDFFATMTVNSALTISPQTKTTVVNRAEIFFASGGIPPYTFQLLSGNGSVNPTTGVFIAPSNTGTSVVRLQDSLYNTVDATITINPDITISPVNPIIMVGNQINFLGGGGIPPFQYNIIAGSGTIDSNGLYTANGGAGSVIIEVKDSRNTTKTTTLTVNQALQFDESPIVVKSGNFKNIAVSGGVPPYTIHFVDNSNSLTNFSPYGSTIVNNTYLLNSSPITTQQGSNEVSVTRTSHGLIVGEIIQLRSLTTCDVFSPSDLNINVPVQSVIDSNTFVISLNKFAINSISCGGSGGFYKKLSGNLPYTAGLVSSLVPEKIAVLDSLLNRIDMTLQIDGGLVAQYDLELASGTTNLFGQGCQTQSIFNLITTNLNATVNGCPNLNAWFLQDTPPSPRLPINYLKLDPVNVGLDLPLNQNIGESNSIEMWFYWDGVRLNTTYSRMDANLVGFSNLNIALMSIKTGVSSYDRALCFNSVITNPYDCYGVKNIDSFIANKWTHLVFIINNGDMNQNKIYVNGIEQGMNIIGGASNNVSQSVNQFVIGSSLMPIPNAGANVNKSTIGGKIGFIKVFNRAITSDEIYNSYNLKRYFYQ
jgi:hypothetical protein